jgi:hypothetical protein
LGRDRPVSKKLEQGLAIGLCVLALNAPQYLRNVELFGSPLGPGVEEGKRYMNDGFSPSIVASNLLRNFGLHAGTPWKGANVQIEQAVDAMHRAIGIALDDPRSTWPGTRFEVRPPAADEDLAGNGLHLLLIAAAMVGALRGGGDRRLRAFAGCLLVAFLLFCVVLRWQPWHGRLHLPLFVLGAPLVGVVFERLRPALLAIGLLLLAVSSVYFLTGNTAHHLVGRRSVFIRTWAEQRVWLLARPTSGQRASSCQRDVPTWDWPSATTIANISSGAPWRTPAGVAGSSQCSSLMHRRRCPTGPAVRSAHVRSSGRMRAHARAD